MPFREKFRRVLRRPEAKEQQPGQQHPEESASSKASSDPTTIHSDPPSAPPSSTSQNPPTPSSPPPNTADSQALVSNGLWDEARSQLLDEAPELINAFENGLLGLQGRESQVPTDGRNEPDLLLLVKQRLAALESSRLGFEVGGKRDVIREQFARMVHAVISVKDVITAVVSSEPHAALAWAGILVLLNPITTAITQDEDALQGLEFLSDLLIRYRMTELTHSKIYGQQSDPKLPRQRVELGASIRDQTVTLYAEILRYQILLAKQYSRSRTFRILSDLIVPENWRGMTSKMTVIDKAITTNLGALGDHTLHEVDKKMDVLEEKMNLSLNLAAATRDEAKTTRRRQLLERLPYTDDAVYGSLQDQDEGCCLEGTQVGILTKLQEWSEDRTGRSVFWLHGMAGTGKSTISRTFATALESRKRLVTGTPLPDTMYLGAAFFFDKTKAGRRNGQSLFTTLARSLAKAVPNLDVYFYKALEQNENIQKQSLAIQCRKLIFEPLRQLGTQERCAPTVIIVIDALDECEPQSYSKLIIDAIGGIKAFSMIGLRFLITSRPEAQLRTEFRDIPDDIIHMEPLNKVRPPQLNGRDDITIFVKHALHRIRKGRSITDDWPGESNTMQLAQKAEGLFIFADTACRFLRAAPRSRVLLNGRLDMILSDVVEQDSPSSGLDKIYTSILFHSVFGTGALEQEKEILSALFKKIIGPVVVLFEPLSAVALSEISFTPMPDVEEILSSLQSVLSVPEDNTRAVELLHLSFRDFLLDPQRCLNPYFRITEVEAHAILHKNCVELMSTLLRRNICDIDVGALVADIEPAQLEKSVPAHLRYACHYWAYHLKSGLIEPSDNDQVHQFLKTHLLHWLEVMSVTGSVPQAVQEINELLSYLSQMSGDKNQELYAVVRDAHRFLLKFRVIIEVAPLQLYASCIVFAPAESITRSIFERDLSESLPRLLDEDTDWDPLLLTIDYVGENAMLSPDGKIVASASGWVWDVATGTVICAPESSDNYDYDDYDDDEPFRATLSDDAKNLICVSRKGKVESLDMATGRRVELVEPCSEDWCSEVTFSADGKKIVMLWDNEGFAFIDVLSQQVLRKNGAEYNQITNVEFHPNGKMLASASDDQTVRLWDPSTGQLLKKFETNSRTISLVRFSHQGAILASLSDDELCLWDPATGRLIRTVDVFGWIENITFSPDAMFLAASSHEQVYVWNLAESGLPAKIPASMCRPVFTPDGKFLSSTASKRSGRTATSGRMIEFWNIETGELVQEFDNNSQIYDLLFSADGRIMASTSDNALRVWDITMHRSTRPVVAHDSQIQRLWLSQDGGLVISEAITWELKLWNAKTGEHLRDFNEGERACGPCFSPDGKWIITLVGEKDIRVRDAESWRTRSKLSRHPSRPTVWAISPDSKLLATASDPSRFSIGTGSAAAEQCAIRLWDLRTRRIVHTLQGHTSGVQFLEFSTNGKLLASASDDGTVRLWDTSTGAEGAIPTGSSGRIGSLTFSPDGETIATSDYEQTIRIWSATTGETIHLLRLSMPANALCFSPDGTMLASFSHPRIRIWDPATGELLGERANILRNADHRFPGIWWSPDGQTLYTTLGSIDLEAIFPSSLGSRNTGAKGAYVDNDWVVQGTEKVLMLPFEHRVHCAVWNDGLLIMGNKSGRLSVLQMGEVNTKYWT
ncbi:hypothetical protein BJX99DRAFT_256220 [Aspergillus californicus]